MTADLVRRLWSLAEDFAPSPSDYGGAFREAAEALGAAHMKMLFHQADAKVANERAEKAEALLKRCEGPFLDRLVAAEARVKVLTEAITLALREMERTAADYHAPGYFAMDCIRQTVPLLRQALEGEKVTHE